MIKQTTLLLILLCLFSFNAFAKPDDITKIVETYSKFGEDTGVLLLVRKAGNTRVFSAGFADKEKGIKIKSNDLFEIGSASKVFTGIAIQQLIEQGKLSLNTSLDKLYPEGKIRNLANFKGKNYWDKVTVGMLLNHTSGFVDYLNVYHDDAKALKILGGDKTYTFKQLIDLALKFGDANFKPGEKFKYCNTGYIILGDIISKVSGSNWRDYIQKNILDVVGMKNTYFGSRLSLDLKKTMPIGHFETKKVTFPPTLANSAGELVSSLTDLEKFLIAWDKGELYSTTETLKRQYTQGFHRMNPKIKNVTYGYAVEKIDNFFGHGGQTFGFQSYITINPKTKDIYVVGVNESQLGSMDLFMKVAGIQYKQN